MSWIRKEKRTRATMIDLPRLYKLGLDQEKENGSHCEEAERALLPQQTSNEFTCQTASQRNDVQGLRGVAISAVLLFHFYPEIFPNGFLGVDIFFVISGFLIVRIFGRAVEKAGGFLTAAVVADFYFRRLRRILPLHLLYCAVAIAIFSWQIDPVLLEGAKKSALAALAFVTNILALVHKYDYFEHVNNEDLFTHVWSLSVEIQFYLLVPLLFGLKKCLGRFINPRVFFISVSAISVVFYVSSSTVFSFHFVFSRLWHFFLVACIEQNESEHVILPVEDDPEAEDVHKNCCSVRQLTLLLSSLAVIVPFIPFVAFDPRIARIGVTLSSAVLIAYGMEPLMLVTRKLLSQRVLVWLGDVSYSLYLFHWPLSTYFVQYTTVLSYARLMLVPASLVLSGFLHESFEKRYREWSLKITVFSCSSLLFVALGLLHSSSTINAYSHQVTEVNLTEAIAINRAVFDYTVDSNGLYSLNDCKYKELLNHSEQQRSDAQIIKYCETPKGLGELRFLVIGNSYAPDQAAIVHKYFKPFFDSFTVYGQVACEVLAVFNAVRPNGGICGRMINFTEIIDHEKPDVIFLIQRYGTAKLPSVPAGLPDPIYDEMLQNLLEVENRTSLVFLLDAFPAMDEEQMPKFNDYLAMGMSSYEINKRVVMVDEDERARPRTQRLSKECKKCILYDVEPAMRCGNFSMCAFDEGTNLSYFELLSHFSPHGHKTIDPVYKDLARQYTHRLKSLVPRSD